MTVGWRSAWCSRAAQRMPLLRGAQAHLWRVPTDQSAPSAGMSSAIAPGAWAPSISTRAALARQRAAISATGSTSPLSAVM